MSKRTTEDISVPDPRLTWVSKVTELLDDRYRIPGTKIRFGIDFILGLAPGLGDAVSFAVSGLLVMTMARYGASGMLVVKMIWNLFVDMVLGSVPLLGNIFDLANKANRRNLRLLEEHYQEGKHQGSAWWVIGLIMFLVLALIVLFIYLFIVLVNWLFS